MTRSQRVAAYCRVSTLDQHADIQVEAIRRAARERGWNLVAEHVDAGVSGGRDRRPALDALLEQVERQEVDVVVVARLDRLGRSLAHVLRLLDLFSRHGVQFVSLADAGLDGTSAVGRMTLQLCAVFAEFERSLLRERTVAGFAAARARGAVWSPPPGTRPARRARPPRAGAQPAGGGDHARAAQGHGERSRESAPRAPRCVSGTPPG